MSAPPHDSEPPAGCRLCPRLAAFRDGWRMTEPQWFNAPVPSFGSRQAELLIVGLAPGLRGANRTGRPFTGDYAGDLLYDSLLRHRFATGLYNARADDGLTLDNCMITNAVRCVPPQNKPLGHEIRTCNTYLSATIQGLVRLKAILALGRVAHDATLAALGCRPAAAKFAHGTRHEIGTITLFDSYHCSRYNTQTRRLTEAMFHDVVAAIRDHLSR